MIKPYEELTLKEKRQLHVELWEWLAKTGSWDKSAAPALEGLRLPFDCVCCAEFRDTFNGCSACPIEWGGRSVEGDNNAPCEFRGSLYARWKGASVGERKALALQIAHAWPEIDEAPALPAGVWLPIEQAPKDGTEILIFWRLQEYYGYDLGRWCKIPVVEGGKMWFISRNGCVIHKALYFQLLAPPREDPAYKVVADQPYRSKDAPHS